MSNTSPAAAPLWFKIAAVAAVVWGLVGVHACYSQLTLSPAQLAALPAAQRGAFAAMPAAIKIDYALAVATGLAGGMCLLLRNAWARAAFSVSLVAVIVQFGWVFLIYRGPMSTGPSVYAFPAFVAAVCGAEIWLAGVAAKRGWLGRG